MITLPNGMTILTKTRPVVFKPTHKPVKLRPMPRLLYGEPIGPFQPPRTMREFIRWECYANGIEPKDVYGLSRAKDIVRIRHRAMHFGVRRLNMSLKMVGRILKRDHTTVLYGVRVVEKGFIAMNDLEQLKLRLVRFPLQTLRSKDARPIVIGELLLAGWKEDTLREHVDEALAWARSAAQAEAQKKEVARRLAKKENKQTTDEAFRSMWPASGNSLDDLR